MEIVSAQFVRRISLTWRDRAFRSEESRPPRVPDDGVPWPDQPNRMNPRQLERQQLRRRLLEMIVQNEALRKARPR